MPLRFDRSFWQAKFSGSNGTQLVAALRFLGLLKGVRPQPDLERLVNATPDDRRSILATILINSYKNIPIEELARATPAMVRTWFRTTYPIDGNTARKAISFFVSGMKEGEIPLSNAVRKMARTKSGNNRSARRINTGKTLEEIIDTPLQQHQNLPRNQTVIHLESGGRITLDVDIDLFSLSNRDRDFVMKLVSLSQEYPPRKNVEPQGLI